VTRYYDLDSAAARLEEVRPLLEGLRADRDRVAELQAELVAFRRTNGNINHAEELGRREEALAEIVRRMESSVRRIDEWDVTLRDIGSGLIDFPALVGGRPVWLCWRLGEAEIAYWHAHDEGFSGRRPLAELPDLPGLGRAD
jgi:hypothetical protein